MTRTEWLCRRQSSLIGMILSILNPGITFLLAYLIYSDWGDGHVENIWLSIFIGILHWDIFSSITSNCVESIVGKAHLLKSFDFNFLFTFLSNYLMSLMLIVVEVILFVIITFFAVESSFEMIFLYFISLLFFLGFMLCVSFILSICRVYFVDTTYIWPILLKILFISTPVLYDPMLLPSKYNYFLMINPLYHFIILLKYCFQGDVYLPFFSLSYMFFWFGLVAALSYILILKVRYRVMEKL